MARVPIYKRFCNNAESIDDFLPASQRIEDSDDSDDNDFNAKINRQRPKRIIHRVVTGQQTTSPILKKGVHVPQDWSRMATTDVGTLIEKSLRMVNGNLGQAKSRGKSPHQGYKGDHKESSGRALGSVKSTQPRHSAIKSKHAKSHSKVVHFKFNDSILASKENTPSQALKPSLRNEKKGCSSHADSSNRTPMVMEKASFGLNNISKLRNIVHRTEVAKLDKTVHAKADKEITKETTNEKLQNVCHSTSGEKMHTPNIASLSDKTTEDQTPVSPIFHSRSRAGGKKAKSGQVQLIQMDSSDSEDDEGCSPVISKKRKLADDSNTPCRGSGEPKSFKRRLLVDEGSSNNSRVPKISSLQDFLSEDSGSNYEIDESVSEDESKDLRKKSRRKRNIEQDFQAHENRSITPPPQKTCNDNADETDEITLIPDSPGTPLSQIIHSDEDYSDEPEQAPKAKKGPRFVFEDDPPPALETRISVSSLASAFNSDHSISSLQESSQNLNRYERCLAEDVLKSAKKKKKKPVRAGLRNRCERAAGMNKSMHAIRCHQIREENERPNKFLLLKIAKIEIKFSVCKLIGKDLRNSSQEYCVLMNMDLCPGKLTLDAVVRILPPWSTLPNKQGRKLILGVLQFEILSDKELRKICETYKIKYDFDTKDKDTVEKEKAEGTKKEIDMVCDCIKKGTGELNCARDAKPCEHLLIYLSRGGGSLGTRRGANKKPRVISQSLLQRIASLSRREAKGVVELVKRFGGVCRTSYSASLSSGQNEGSILQLRVLQPLQLIRDFGIHVETDIGFIAEDKRGHFVIVKLDPDVVDQPGTWQPFVDGVWEELIGSVVRVSGLVPKNRIQTSRSSRLINVLSMFHVPKQTNVYTLKVFLSCRQQIVSRDLTNLPVNIPDILDLNPPHNVRISFTCAILHKVEGRENFLLVHSNQHQYPTVSQIFFNKEVKVPSDDLYPVLVTMYGVCTESGKMLLDHYSACILKAKRLKFPYHDKLTTWSGAEDVAPYVLTRIKGQVESVCVDDCVQWLQCGECGSQEILQLPDEKLCNRCQASFIRNNIRLVLKIKSQKILLEQSTACQLLADQSKDARLKQPLPEEVLEGLDEDQRLLASTVRVYDSSLDPSSIVGLDLDLICVRHEEDLKTCFWRQVPHYF